MKWQKYQYFQKWPKLCAIPQDFASLCTVDLAIVYEQGFVYYMGKHLCAGSCAHYPPEILSPCPNMSSLESLKHHHFMDKSRLRGGDVSKINTLCHHNVRKEHMERGLYVHLSTGFCKGCGGALQI